MKCPFRLHALLGLAHVKLKTGLVQTDDDEEAVGTFAYIDRSGKRVFAYRGRGVAARRPLLITFGSCPRIEN